MAIEKIEKHKHYSFGLWKIEEDEDALLHELKPKKTEEKQIKYFNNIHRKKQNIAARLLLNNLAKQKVFLNYEQNGAPVCSFFKFISISHSKNYSMVIVSNSIVGVDIQYIKPNIIELSKKFISSKEKHQFKKDITQLHFVWCAKEAIYKTLKQGSVSFKDNIYIEDVKHKSTTKGYYINNKSYIKYNIYCESLSNYCIAITNLSK